MEHTSSSYIPMEKRILNCIDFFMLDAWLYNGAIDVVVLVSTEVKVDIRFIKRCIKSYFCNEYENFSYSVDRVNAGDLLALKGHRLAPKSLFLLVESKDTYKPECLDILKATCRGKHSKYEVILEETNSKKAFTP